MMEEMLLDLRRMGIKDERVLAAVEAVDRQLFVPEEYRQVAYVDRPLPIGSGQTISQPYTVARMIELLIMKNEEGTISNENNNNPPSRLNGGASPLKLRGDNSKVLEIGTGSGWQTCILAKLFKQVYSVEIIPELAKAARNIIYDLRFANIQIHIGDGKKGWREYAPYNGIICGANADEIPQAWKDQLADGGRIVCPVRGEMTRVTKITHPLTPSLNLSEGEQFTKLEKFGRYSFVPLV